MCHQIALIARRHVATQRVEGVELGRVRCAGVVMPSSDHRSARVETTGGMDGAATGIGG
jgi:hypothetical protein